MKPSWNGLANASTLPQATRTRKMRTKNKMSVPLYPQQKPASPETKTMKVVRKTIAKTPCFTMPKTTRKKLHWVTKSNCRCQIRRIILTTNMNMTTEPVPRTLTAMATATETLTATVKVTGIPATEQGLCNGYGSLALAHKRKCWDLWQRPKHPR